MDAVEGMAVEEPLNARVLTLHTIANEYVGKKEKWEAIRREAPKVRIILPYLLLNKALSLPGFLFADVLVDF